MTRRSRITAIVLAWYVVLALMLNWPVLELFNKAGPFIGPFPPFVFWITLWTIVGVAVHVWIGLVVWEDPSSEEGEENDA